MTSKENRKPPANSHPWKRPAVVQKKLKPTGDTLASVMPKELLQKLKHASTSDG
jgi:hypothetical protein